MGRDRIRARDVIKKRLLLHKRYFDLGYGITSYIKVIVAVIGIGEAATGNKILPIIMLLAYGLLCYLTGWAFVKYGWYMADLEITNKNNLFVKEMRKTYKRKV